MKVCKPGEEKGRQLNSACLALNEPYRNELEMAMKRAEKKTVKGRNLGERN
jgi:hypothetical protein